MSTKTHRFNVSAFKCTAAVDSMHTYKATSFFSNAPEKLRVEALSSHDQGPEEIEAPFSVLFVDTGRHKVLMDTGMGIGVDPIIGRYEGDLLKNLRDEGVAAEDIDTVILSHCHADHIGGNVDEAGKPVFPNAQYVISKDEWDFWTTESTLETVHPVHAGFARRNLPPLEDRMVIVDSEKEIVPGVHAIEAKGHTAGHMAVALSSGNDLLLYTADTAMHQVSLEHPEWRTEVYDHDLEQSAASRRRLFDRAATDGALVATFHFTPFPSLGHVVKSGDGWEWQPV